MCDLCDLNNSTGGFILTICKTCHVPLIISRKHEEKFSLEEIEKIKRMFPNEKIRWSMRKIPDHAHCHIEKRR